MQRLVAVVFLTLIFSFLQLSSAFAVKKKEPAKMHLDTSKIRVKKFDAHAIAKYKADKDFDYTGDANRAEQSLWSRFWNWIWDTISDWFSHIPYSGVFLKYFLLSLCVALIVYLVFKSLGIDPIKLWRGESQKVDLAYSESLENIHEINFDNEIESAVSQHNYRLAVRLLYLKCLKQLSDAQLIQWQIDKTNAAYLYELTDPLQKQTFGVLTRQFEYVWYGNFIINKDTYGDISQLFQNFKKQLV